MRWPTLSLFKQQRLPAWQPLLSPRYVAIWLLAVAAIFIPIGIALMVANSTASDLTFRYDHINKCTTNNHQRAFSFSAGPGESVVLRRGCVTEVTFELKRQLRAPVYLYYGLTQFYQNHRRFSNSKHDAQLAGRSVDPSHLFGSSPLAFPGELHDTGAQKLLVDGKEYEYRDCVYSPAGLIPWSMFNDTFRLYKVMTDAEQRQTPKGSSGFGTRALVCDSTSFSKRTNEPLSSGPHVDGLGCRKKGIAWDTDVAHKYKLPDFEFTNHPIWSASRSKEYDLPPEKIITSNDTYFNEGWYAGEAGHAIPVSTDEDLMVWARVASLPSFRKLFRVITQDLAPGKYVMVINEHYDVSSFGGKKSFSLSTLSWVGGRNTVLSSMYMWIGIASLLGALLFVATHVYYGDRAQQALAHLLRS